jgi:hypothetical protein
MRNPFTRGSALPETALVMSAVLLIFLGLMRLAFVGYQQSQTDVVAFVAAHEGSFGSTAANQQTYGVQMGQKVYSGAGHLPSGSVTVNTASGVLQNPGGNVVGYANQSAGWIHAFGPSAFTLHSFFIEPTASTPYSAVTSSFSVVSALPPNCTTHNTATPTCSDIKASFAAPNPSNTTDPYYAYACHSVYYAALSSWSGFAPDQNVYFAPLIEDLFTYASGTYWNYVLPDSASLSALTDQNGVLMSHYQTSEQAWPRDFQPTASDGINNSSVRSTGTWLTTQYRSNGTVDPANADGLATSGGSLGKVLLPIFNFGSGSSKC